MRLITIIAILALSHVEAKNSKSTGTGLTGKSTGKNTGKSSSSSVSTHITKHGLLNRYIHQHVRSQSSLLQRVQTCATRGLINEDYRECSMFASFFDDQDIGHILALTDIVESCPCQEATVEILDLEGTDMKDVNVCSSLRLGYGFRAYERYCLDNYDSVEDAEEGILHQEAYANYLAVVEEMAINPDGLSPQERYEITAAAFAALPSASFAEDCLGGCARFVAEYCCGEEPIEGIAET